MTKIQGYITKTQILFRGPTKLLSLHYDPPLLFIGTCILFMWGKKANYVTSSIFLYSVTVIGTSKNSWFCKEIREDNFRFWWRRVHECMRRFASFVNCFLQN
jgi:hypothetical protein